MNNKRLYIVSLAVFIVTLLVSWAQFRLSRYCEKVPVDVYGSAIIVPVGIGDSTYNFQLDTGAPTSISLEIFNELRAGIVDSVLASDFYGNEAYVHNTVIPEITIGNSRFTRIDAGIVNPIQSFRSCGINVDGYLGSDFFRDKTLLIDLKHQEMSFSNYPNYLLPDSVKALRINFKPREKTPLLPISIKGDSEYGEAIFDTGAAGDFFVLAESDYYKMYSDSAINQLNIIDTLNAHRTGRGIFGKQKDTINYIVRFDSIKIGPITSYGQVARTVNADGRSILGAHALYHGKVIIDFLNGRFFIDPYSEPAWTLKNTHFGFSLKYKNGRFMVNSVAKESTADLNNIKNGDILVKVNSTRLDSLSTCQLLRLHEIFEECRQPGEYVFENDEKVVYLL